MEVLIGLAQSLSMTVFNIEPVVIPMKSRIPRRGRPVGLSRGVVLTGVAASVLLHGLLLTPVLWGGHRSRKPPLPDIQGASASADNKNSLESMLVVFEEDPAAIHDLQNEESAYPFILPTPPLQKLTRVDVPSPALLSLDDSDEQPASEANGNQMGRSFLFGRYMGQISARIERGWIRPRVRPDGGSFACRVNIVQDRQGTVQEVTLEKCDGQAQWQLSLVRAIQGASPMPAPPDATVFSNLITLEFDSPAYVEGRGEEGFEPAPKIKAEVPLEPVARRTRPDGSVDLRITGSRDLNRGPMGDRLPLDGRTEMQGIRSDQ